MRHGQARPEKSATATVTVAATATVTVIADGAAEHWEGERETQTICSKRSRRFNH